MRVASPGKRSDGLVLKVRLSYDEERTLSERLAAVNSCSGVNRAFAFFSVVRLERCVAGGGVARSGNPRFVRSPTRGLQSSVPDTLRRFNKAKALWRETTVSSALPRRVVTVHVPISRKVTRTRMSHPRVTIGYHG